MKVSNNTQNICRQTSPSLTWFVLVSGFWSFSFIPYEWNSCMSHLPAAASTHNHTNTLTHTHALGQIRADGLHTVFILAASRRRRAHAQIWRKGGGTFRSAGQSAPGSTQTFFRVTHVRDSIDARAGGACVLNIIQQRRSRGAITGWKC